MVFDLTSFWYQYQFHSTPEACEMLRNYTNYRVWHLCTQFWQNTLLRRIFQGYKPKSTTSVKVTQSLRDQAHFGHGAGPWVSTTTSQECTVLWLCAQIVSRQAPKYYGYILVGACGQNGVLSPMLSPPKLLKIVPIRRKQLSAWSVSQPCELPTLQTWAKTVFDTVWERILSTSCSGKQSAKRVIPVLKL